MLAADPSLLGRLGDLAPLLAALAPGVFALGGVLLGKKWER